MLMQILLIKKRMDREMNISEDIDMVMLMYSLIEYSDNIWKLMAITWRYISHSDNINNDAVDFGEGNHTELFN